MIYFCCDQFRRSAVRGSALNGIDFVEVVDREPPRPRCASGSCMCIC